MPTNPRDRTQGDPIPAREDRPVTEAKPQHVKVKLNVTHDVRTNLKASTP